MSNFMDGQVKRDFSTRGGPSVAGGEDDAQAMVRAMMHAQTATEGGGAQVTPIHQENAPAVQQSAASDFVQGDQGFSRVSITDKGVSFAHEWSPTMDIPTYIGDTNMLLHYLYSQERYHRVTMPIKACGVDPIVFDNLQNVRHPYDEGETHVEGAEHMFEIAGAEHTEPGQAPAYELISVDGDLYLSCTTECLDADYLQSILSEATAALKSRGQYIYEEVGLRKLKLEEGKTTSRLLKTLKLNTYEMSVLVEYLSQFDKMNIEYGTLKGKQCIVFTLGA